MNRLKQALVWLSRLTHCRGFGIQSPTDYRFVRYVINEHWPYYAYEQLDKPDDDWLQRKLGHLYFRLANERQPRTIIDGVGFRRYMQAGCRKAQIMDDAKVVELAVVPVQTDYNKLFKACNDRSIVVLQDIYKHPSCWHNIAHDPRVTVSFDLYYCGIVMFDSKRVKQSYVINF